jgi:hypothetical protein
LIYHRFMDFFYISVEADELTPAEVEAVCRARAKEPRCFRGANVKVKSIFREFLYVRKHMRVLEVGAGLHPVLTSEEARDLGIVYITADSDSAVTSEADLFSRDASGLKYSDEYFDVSIALFVLHFAFSPPQIHEVYRCLSEEGVFLANIYRRSASSRDSLVDDFISAGFLLH